jgi:hypothetical protein
MDANSDIWLMCLAFFHMYVVYDLSVSGLLTRDRHCMSPVPLAQNKAAQNNSTLFY